MDLQQLREQVAKADFIKEIKEEILKILDEAIARGYILQEEQDKILSFIDFEMDKTDVDLYTVQKMENIATELVDNIDNAIKSDPNGLNAL